MHILTLAHRLDVALLFRSMAFCERKSRLQFVRGISRTGDGYVQVLALLIVWFIETPAARHFLVTLCLAFVIERILYFILKNSLRRRRPHECMPSFVSHITASDRFSFPSGHTSASVLFAVLLLPVSLTGGLVAMVWAMAIGFSRVALGVHFPSDIVAGAALGTTVGLYALASSIPSNLIFIV